MDKKSKDLLSNSSVYGMREVFFFYSNHPLQILNSNFKAVHILQTTF